MQNLKINVYDNVTSPTVKKFTTITEWFELIKKSSYSASITEARKFTKGDKVYDNTKLSLPCVTYNFTFHTKKANSNIDSGTGLLYIDIDTPEFNINILDTSKVFSYYKSYGGKGYSILVKVEGLTLDNYNYTFYSICNQLGITQYIDKGAKKATQYNVLSFDKDIFINHDSFIFTAIQNVSPSVFNIKKETYTTEGDTFLNIRYDNLDEVHFEGNYHFDWKGFDLIACVIPWNKIKEGSRNNFLLSYTANLVYLNPTINKSLVMATLKGVNNQAFFQPCAENQLQRVTDSIFKYLEAGTLQPNVHPKKRFIFFAKDCTMDRLEKLDKCRELLANKRSNDSIQKLNDIIESWDFETLDKITIRKIVKNFPISMKTVTKYWSEFKSFVADLNNEYKENNTMKSLTKKQYILPEATPLAVASIEPIPAIVINEEIDILEYCAADGTGIYIGNYKLFKENVGSIYSKYEENIIKQLLLNDKVFTDSSIFQFTILQADNNKRFCYYEEVA